MGFDGELTVNITSTELRTLLSDAPTYVLAEVVTPHYVGDRFHCPACYGAEKRRMSANRKRWQDERGRGGALRPQLVAAMLRGPTATFVDEFGWRCDHCGRDGYRGEIERLILREPLLRGFFLDLIEEDACYAA